MGVYPHHKITTHRWAPLLRRLKVMKKEKATKT